LDRATETLGSALLEDDPDQEASKNPDSPTQVRRLKVTASHLEQPLPHIHPQSSEHKVRA
ncbi:MAG TPA: hypothetical protein VGR66_04680, partial [Candidatus Eisenbacteria bacterium]|nr:hypothetical protein [Candidatus Eisenbacteria bacterium]